LYVTRVAQLNATARQNIAPPPCHAPQWFFFVCGACAQTESPRPAESKKGGADIAASPSPSILVALLICCSACNTAHVGDLYPASSHSSVRFVSFPIFVIRACSWPSQHSCFFRKFHPPLVIVHPRPGSRHVVRPSVVLVSISFHPLALPIPATSLGF